MMSRYRIALTTAAIAAACLLSPASSAMAQGKGHGNHDERGEHVPPGQAKKKVVTADEAIVVTRDVLVSHGYEIVRVERVRTQRVVYYRRGNMGRGKGKGPIERIVTADQAIIVTRDVLVSHGYEVVRVDVVHGTRVVYYRRGNMGRGKGKGPIERIVIRPEPDRVVFVSPPPRGLMVDINVRLGM